MGGVTDPRPGYPTVHLRIVVLRDGTKVLQQKQTAVHPVDRWFNVPEFNIDDIETNR